MELFFNGNHQYHHCHLNSAATSSPPLPVSVGPGYHRYRLSSSSSSSTLPTPTPPSSPLHSSTSFLKDDNTTFPLTNHHQHSHSADAPSLPFNSSTNSSLFLEHTSLCGDPITDVTGPSHNTNTASCFKDL